MMPLDPIVLIEALTHPNVSAFARMIRLGEGTRDEDGYRRMYGGELFDSFADHPRKKITKGGWTSTAAGAYQFLSRTWDGLVKQYGFADFSPKNQDLGCVALIKGRKALDDVIAGRFEAAVMKCNKEWASLPGSPYGQPVVTMERAKREYEAHGGTYEAAPEVPARFMDGAPPPAFPDDSLIETALTAQEAPMAPLIPIALQVLSSIVPQLGSLFGSGSEVSQRNMKAAEVVIGAAKAAAGAVNEQDLIERVQAGDPAVVAAVQEAVKGVWYEVVEAGGGGIAAARVMNEKAASQPGAGFKTPAFVVAAMLMPLVYMTVYYVLTGDFPSEVKSMVIAAVVSGVLGAVTGFFLGSSFSSQRKDQIAR